MGLLLNLQLQCEVAILQLVMEVFSLPSFWTNSSTFPKLFHFSPFTLAPLRPLLQVLMINILYSASSGGELRTLLRIW